MVEYELPKKKYLEKACDAGSIPAWRIADHSLFHTKQECVCAGLEKRLPRSCGRWNYEEPAGGSQVRFPHGA